MPERPTFKDPRSPAKDGASEGRDTRHGAMVSVSDLLRQVTPDHGVEWAALVGSQLAELTVPLGVNDVGTLRVMAANETALRELQAREGAVLDVWNMAAERKSQPEAKSLQAWVRAGLVVPNVSKRAPVANETSSSKISKGLRSQAAKMSAHVHNASVREALADMRARALALEARKKEESDA